MNGLFNCLLFQFFLLLLGYYSFNIPSPLSSFPPLSPSCLIHPFSLSVPLTCVAYATDTLCNNSPPLLYTHMGIYIHMVGIYYTYMVGIHYMPRGPYFNRPPYSILHCDNYDGDDCDGYLVR